MDWQEYWASKPSCDYDEMVAAKDAWDYQQKELKKVQARFVKADNDHAIEQLETRNKQLLDALFEIMDITRSSASAATNSPAKIVFRVASSAVQT